jgi:putative phosphoribosyl transferase
MGAKIVEDPAFRDRVSVFSDRFEAGSLLAGKLQEYANNESAVILAIPAGGVPVGYTAARALGVMADVVVVRKVQIPWCPEAGFGAVTWGGSVTLNECLVEQLGLTESEIEASISLTKKNVQERLNKYRGAKPLPDLTGKVVILVDDGLASGFTMLAAVRAVKEQSPKKVVVAIPTASLGAIELLAPEVDEIVCLNIRSGPSFAVADAYKNWYDLTDEEVQNILAASR